MAVDPPADVAAEITGWARAASQSGLRPMPPANVHLTLAFLGNRPSGDVDTVLSALETVIGQLAPLAPIALTTLGPVWLPPRRPRALALDVDDPSGELAGLRASVAAELEQRLGWDDDRPRFRPHLTAGRISSPPEQGALPPAPRLAFSVDALTLYRSFLRPDGARYEALGSVPFGSMT